MATSPMQLLVCDPVLLSSLLSSSFCRFGSRLMCVCVCVCVCVCENGKKASQAGEGHTEFVTAFHRDLISDRISLQNRVYKRFL